MWALVATIALLLGIGLGSEADDAAETAAPTPEPVPTVTVTAEPEIIETDPSEETLAELDERAAELDDRETALDEREQSMDEQAGELEQRAAELDEREEELGAAELDVAEGTIPGSGLFLVGEDIQPGTYRGEGGSMCYWARLSGTSGELDDVIANGLPEGPTVVTIAESDVAFETRGCSDWVRQ